MGKVFVEFDELTLAQQKYRWNYMREDSETGQPYEKGDYPLKAGTQLTAYSYTCGEEIIPKLYLLPTFFYGLGFYTVRDLLQLYQTSRW